MSEAIVALRELCERRLFRSTHYRVEEYLRDSASALAELRFGWTAEEIFPVNH